MLRVGDKITIRPSHQLSMEGNEALVNKTGTITKLVDNNDAIYGAYVDVKIMRRVKNCFIPIKSIEGPEHVNKVRVNSILKATIL